MLDSLTDDQIALIGCVIAMGVAFGVMALTGALRQSEETQQRPSPLAARPRPATIAAHQASDRKAA